METSRTWPACPVCQSNASRSYVEFPQLTFVKCAECGCVYKSRELATLLPDDFYEQSYFHGRKSGRDKRFAHRVRKSMQWLRSAAEWTNAERILDVGCSFGYVLEAASRLGMTASGVDVSRYAVQVCRERGYDAHVGTLETLPFEDGRFQIVHLKHVLEHTPTPKRALQEVRRVCAPGAAVLVAVPDLDYWKGNFLRQTYRFFRPDDLGAQHYVYYNQQSLVSMLEGNGFKVRAAGKDFFRRKLAGQSVPRRIFETVRFLGLRVAMSVARAFNLRRELFLIAEKV